MQESATLLKEYLQPKVLRNTKKLAKIKDFLAEIWYTIAI